jgi:general nucleoside transport system ATP-binding protein
MKAVVAQGIGKRYEQLAANRDVSLEVEAGTIHAVVGENGAGKSTLLSIVYGSVRADAGRLWIKGDEVALGTHRPAGAIARGLGLVHQHFMLVPNLSVLENVILGREPRRRAAAEAEVAALARRLSLELDPRRVVEDLSVGEQQRVEIIKALWRGADVLLLDEPTAVLTPPEVKSLFAVLERLAQEGKTIVLVTHKLDEVVAVADRTTVMRGGRVVAEYPAGTDVAVIAGAIVGGEGAIAPPGAAAGPAAAGPGNRREPGNAVLELRDVAVPPRLARVSLRVRAGEILGIAGVLGNGQSELVLAIAGLVRPARGTIAIGGRDVTRTPPGARLAAGLAHIPEDRHLRGLILDFTLAENLRLGRHREPGLAHAAAREAFVRQRLAALDVRPADPALLARKLSGGNQQKLVAARELGRPALRLIVAAEPTRGVDIGATARIHQALREARDGGAGILLVSSELSELRALADRLLVLYRGVEVATLPPTAADDELGALMTGARAASERAGQP